MLVVCLLAGGCSGHKPELALAAKETLEMSDSPVVVSQTFVMPEALDIQELEVEIEKSEEKIRASDLEWDATEQRRVVNEGDGPVPFRFQMKNISQETIVIEKVNVSCGCTTFDTRAMPLSLEPNALENIQINMNITGKFGTVTKSIMVQGSHATWSLLVTCEIKPSAGEVLLPGVSNGAGMSAGVRGMNIGLAKADRQAVFKGGCAECHARSAERQLGYGLYLGACAICHDARHRASMVPDLRVPDETRDTAYWREHITEGIEGTLMPAFAKEKGGILSEEQIESLVKFLVETPLVEHRSDTAAKN